MKQRKLKALRDSVNFRFPYELLTVIYSPTLRSAGDHDAIWFAAFFYDIGNYEKSLANASKECYNTLCIKNID